MSDFEWDDENWEILIYAIQQKNCILMLGPDAAYEELKGQPRLSETLANQLAEKINPSDLAQVSQYYCMEKGRHSLEFKTKWRNYS